MQIFIMLNMNRHTLLTDRTVIIISYLGFNMQAILSEHRALIVFSVMSKN